MIAFGHIVVGMIAARIAWIPVLALPLLAAVSGEEVYKKVCQNCHEVGDSRAPGKQQLQTMSAARLNERRTTRRRAYRRGPPP